MFYLLLPVFLIVGALVGLYTWFLVRRLKRFYIPQPRPWFRWVQLALAVVIGVCAVDLFWSGSIVILHILFFSGILDLLTLALRPLARRVCGEKVRLWLHRIYGCGLVPVVLAAGLLAYGWFNMRGVVAVEHTVTTDHVTEPLTLVFLSDTHYGTIQDPAILAEKAAEISAMHPSAVILGGDIVEDGTSAEEMREAFRLLGGIESDYGVFYVYGNHDKQNYSSNRAYTHQELEQAAESAGVRILCDETVAIGDAVLVGRNDLSAPGRASLDTLLNGYGTDRFIVVADHQPNDTSELGAAGVDLQLSGHTHGAQIWPATLFFRLTGRLCSGEYDVDGCEVIVSNGFAGWGYPIRTAGHSQYEIVHIERTPQN